LNGDSHYWRVIKRWTFDAQKEAGELQEPAQYPFDLASIVGSVEIPNNSIIFNIWPD